MKNSKNENNKVIIFELYQNCAVQGQRFRETVINTLIHTSFPPRTKLQLRATDHKVVKKKFPVCSFLGREENVFFKFKLGYRV